MSYPVYLDHSPSKNFVGAMRSVNIFFRIEDEDGINLSTLKKLQ